ncbi:hypothetical protein NW752_008035 [Fusarium irregulare]|uniref:Uncharacterized protein n=1 Tax=Fusarium irregulare TaxID=2494466 RepID=A0A9W8UBW2_9HYPO|nr:hypothetical protein NW752_008035 [Fusarium irregulare]KAJ4019693.1 hypothetical protein NW766_003451 [Fusarium irregulare]
MIAYQAYRAQTALKEDQASKFRDLITSGPNQAVPRQAADLAEWLQDNHQTLGHLALEELDGIAKELAFTCRKEFTLRNEFLGRFPHAYQTLAIRRTHEGLAAATLAEAKE